MYINQAKIRNFSFDQKMKVDCRNGNCVMEKPNTIVKWKVSFS